MTTLSQLKPNLIWHYFEEITKIPRPSGKEEKIRAYLLHTAQILGLDVRTDKTGNVLITKSASSGREKEGAIILQAHIDMVCEKNNTTQHDFEKDAIEAYIDGDWVKARGTTLGADNGIGMAAALAILASTDLQLPKIEALFTVEEETGLTGALGIEEGFLSGDTLLNLDSEDEDEIFVSCAGGIDSIVRFTYSPTAAPDAYHYMQLDINNLSGGHSGCDIQLGRGNANQLLARFIYDLQQQMPLVLCSFHGGNLRNAIPREANAIIGVPNNLKEQVRIAFNIFTAAIEGELHRSEPKLHTTVTSIEKPDTIIDNDTAQRFINAVYACPNGIIAMSQEMEGLVETSTNLASVRMKEDHIIEVVLSQRSLIESAKMAIANRIDAIFSLAGASVVHGDGYPGWKPNMDSAILKKAIATYQELFDITPTIKGIHAGLECGLFLKKYPHLDIISFGPTLKDVHSPDERMYIPAVEKFWKHLTAILSK